MSSNGNDVLIKINGAETELTSSSPSPSLNDDTAIDDAKQKIWRDSSYEFSNHPREFDFVDTDSPLSQSSSSLSKIPESPNYGVQLRSNATTAQRIEQQPRDREEVLVCTSTSFRQKSNLLKTRSNSRLMDPPANEDHRSQRLVKSGIIGKGSEIDEDDPFLDEDLPENYKKMKFSTLSVLQLLSLILIIAALICSLTIRKLRKKTIVDLELWKWEIMILVLICGRLVSGWVIWVAVFFIERNFLLRKLVLYFVYGLRNAVQNCIWLSLVLIAWQCIFDKRVERVTNTRFLPYVTKIWVGLVVGTLIWLLKTLLFKVLASSFHVNTFFDRIQESLFNQYVIVTLSGPPLIEIQQEEEEEEIVMAGVYGLNVPADLRANVFPKSGNSKVIGNGTPRKTPTSSAVKSPMFSRVTSKKENEEEGITIDHLHRLNQKNVSAWNMKRLINIVRKGVLSTLDEKLQDSTGEDESAVQITSEIQAKAAAKKIFGNVAKAGSKFISQEDLMRFMREDEALKTFRLFDGAKETKDISKRALKNWVVNAFRERRALALTLNDTKTAVNKLHYMLNVLVGVVIVVIWLLILRVATTHFLVFLSSQLLLVGFMFGNTCKTTFEAIIFLFVMHPYDVGDRVEVEGVQMVVEEMNILTTVFLRYDNQKIFYPNAILATKPISNFYRSPDMGDAIDFCIHISTPMEKIAMMKERITRYIENKTDHWYPAPRIVLRDVEDMNRLKISVLPLHTMNHQDMGKRWARRALLVEEMIKVLKDLDIEYRMLPLDVNLRNMPALTSDRLPSNWTACG